MSKLLGPIIFCLVFGYIFGCFSTGYLVSKAYNIDVRKYGSGNSGTTNILRTLGKKGAIITLIGDMLKSAIPMLLVKYLIFPNMDNVPLLSLYTGLGAVLGHNFPFWQKFKGGKGIASSAGALITLDPLAIIFGLPIFALVIIITRYVSLGSLCAAVFFPIWVAIRFPGDIHMLIVSMAFTILAFVRHRSNIKRLINGTENKIGQRVKIDEQ